MNLYLVAAHWLVDRGRDADAALLRECVEAVERLEPVVMGYGKKYYVQSSITNMYGYVPSALAEMLSCTQQNWLTNGGRIFYYPSEQAARADVAAALHRLAHRLCPEVVPDPYEEYNERRR